MKIYFARPTDIYGTSVEYTRLESDCVRLIMKTFPNLDIEKDIEDPKKIFFSIKDEADKLKGKEREKFITDHTMQALKRCDTIVYTNTYTRKKNINFPKGVKEEINYALKNKDKYKIYRIYLCGHDGDIETAQVKGIQELNNEYITKKTKEDFSKYTVENMGWALKTVDDYVLFYENNPGAIGLMKKWFIDIEHIGKGAIASHYSHIFETKDRTNIGLVNCRAHYGMKHATIVPDSQLYDTECPYLSYRKFSPGYATNKLFMFPKDEKGIMNLVSSSRVVHKFWDIFDSATHLTYGGIALRDENGDLVKDKSGKYIADTSLIVGVRPLVDIDIQADVKNKYNFFSEPIFKEYGIAIDALLEYLDDDSAGNRWRIQFSGNGIYLESEPMDFKKEGVDYDEFDRIWSGNSITRKIGLVSQMDKMRIILDNAGIKYLTLENYSWNQYFKLPFSFHASKERVSIPLNKNIGFDNSLRKYIDEMSSIRRGLNENIFNEVMINAGKEWR